MYKPLRLLPILALPALAAAQTQSASDAAATHLAGLLANDARDLLRNPALPPDVAAAQAAILLQFSVKLDGSDLHTQRLLAETARLAGKTDVQRLALRAVIAADPGDLVSQVHYIELLAADSQTMEARAALYQNALAATTIDPQIRSEIAVRLAHLAEDRGDVAQAKDYLIQALKLNDINIGALRDEARFAAEATGPGAVDIHMQALSALLVANPYQPDAWLQVGHECQIAGVHDRAAEFMETASEQMQMNGTSPPGEFYLNLAMEQAIAGQRAKAFPLASGLAQLPNAPLEALLLSEVLSQSLPPQPAPATTATTTPSTKPAFDRAAEIRKRLAEMAKDTSDASALANAAGADLTIMAQPGPDTVAWIAAYGALVDPTDTTLARLNGWLLLRQGNLEEARAALEKIAPTDPLAQVGLARLQIKQNKSDAARDILQKLWNGNPHGLLALQVSVAAAAGNIKLADAPPAKQMRAAIGRLTSGLSGMHTEPHDAELISTYLRKSSVSVGEAVMMQLRMTNATDRALPVGPEGMVKTMIGIAATTRGGGVMPLGICSLEDVQRTYRLEPRQMLETTLRVDQGKLADLLQQNPDTSYTVSVTAVTAPRLIGTEQFSAGVGGMVVASDDFQRGRLPLETAADFQKLTGELTTLTGDKQLVRIEAAGAVYGKRADDVRGGLGAALKGLASSGDSLVKTSLLRAMPPIPAESELGKALDALAGDADPLVRLAWAKRESQLLLAGKENPAAKAALEKQASVEKDELVKEWITLTLKAASPAATEPH